MHGFCGYTSKHPQKGTIHSLAFSKIDDKRILSRLQYLIKKIINRRAIQIVSLPVDPYGNGVGIDTNNKFWGISLWHFYLF